MSPAAQTASGSRKAANPERFGEYYTTRQVAILLGVNPSRVRELRLTNRLQGYQRPVRNKIIRRKGSTEHKEPSTGHRWWFFKKTDVDNLLLDTTYTHHRRGYDRWKNRTSS